MTKAIELTNVRPGDDRFAVVLHGEVITTHPTLRGAMKLAARFNETGRL